MGFKKGLEATKHPTSMDIAWAAGIFEGEGWSGKPTDSYRVVITQKDTWLLYKLQRLFGGTVYEHKYGGCSSWRVFGPRAHGFIMTVFSYLSPRRRGQIKAALAKYIYKNNRPNPSSIAYAERCQASIDKVSTTPS